MNLEVKTLDKLIETVVVLEEGGVSPLVTLLAGVPTVKRGLFVIKQDQAVVFESYGLNELLHFIKTNTESMKTSVVKYITLTQEQLDVCVFGVHVDTEDEELIKTIMKINSVCGERIVCGEGNECQQTDACHNHVEDQEAIVEEDSTGEIGDVQQEESDLVDWDYVDAMYDEEDKNTSKLSLEEYAKGYGVVLKKNTTYQKMVETFKEVMGVE
jgi:hypothetical protein